MILAMALPATASQPMPQVNSSDQVAGETIRIGTDAAYPPFEEIDDEGNYVGFDIELMEALAEDAGFEIEWINAPFDGIFSALEAGDFDAVISAATITEERLEQVDFSDPYFVASQSISVTVDNAETISEPDDLVGMNIGVQLGTTGEEYAEGIDGVEVLSFDSTPLAFQALSQGDVDAVIADTPTSQEIIATNPDLNATIVGDPLTEEFYGIAVRKDFPELLEAINVSLENVIADGLYAELFEAWFDVPPSEDFLPAEEMVDVDMTDPESVAVGILQTTFSGDLDGLSALLCEDALMGEDMVTEEDLALFEGFEFDFSEVEYETETDGEEAYVTLSGTITITVAGQSEEGDVSELFDEPLRFVQDGDNWLFCPVDDMEMEEEE
jgi:ABC-type amino acid transport substrate-binding protein